MQKPTSKIIMELFESRGWACDNSEYSMYRRACRTYDSFDTSESKKLFLKILSKTNYVCLEEYKLLAFLLLKSIVERFKDERSIHVAPMKDNSDSICSSDFISYFFKSKELFYYSWFAKKRIKVFGVGNSFQKLGGSTLFLVDDFIGSGETAEKSLRYYSEEKRIPENNIYLCSFFASNSFLKSDLYNEKKGNVLYLFREKDAGFFFDNSELYTLRDNELFHLNSKPENRLGYNNTGALITLLRTPNNSLPILWKEYATGNNAFSAPFPRKG